MHIFYKDNLIIFLLIILIILIIIINTNTNKEHFETKNIVSIWQNGGSGFYSQLNFKLNHYLYCKKHGINYKTESNNWSYKYKNGWTDYFQDVQLKFNNNESDNIEYVEGCCRNLEEFTLQEYVDIIPEYYKYSDEIQNIINNKKKELGLIDSEYGSLYIRRGDKLVYENDYIETSVFIDKLLNIYPECKTIFLQTDDYNCFIDLQNYIKKNNLNIKALTLCPDNVFGSICWSDYTNLMKENKNANQEYLDSIKSKLSKPLDKMTPDEIYEHTLELITSVDICINSKYCVCDYKSNVARFIKVAHKNVMNVFDVKDGDKLFDLKSYKSIGWNF